MRRKMATALLAVLVVCLLAGCGNTGQTKTSQSKPSTSEKKADVGNKKFEVEKEYKKLPESEGFKFESNGDGTCVLKEIGLCKDKDIVIPEKSPEGDLVTEIAEYAFDDAKNISRIIFAGRKMKIDDAAFQECEVEQLIISGCELTMGDDAFAYCKGITNVYISNSDIEASEYTFYDSGKNMEVKLHNVTGTLDDESFQTCRIASLNIENSSIEMGDNAFAYCDDLKTMTVTNSKIDMGRYAFYDTGKDAEVIFKDCKLNIDDEAFESCGIKTISISGGDAICGDNAFAYCDDLTDFTIEASQIEIGKYAFYDCSELNNISIAAKSKDDNYKIVIKDDAFASSAVQKAVIGRGSVAVGDNAFAYCDDLVKVEWKGNVTKAGRNVFYGCPDELEIMYKGKAYNKLSIEDAM